jgi:ABC-type sugar transport system substrate-binding protein
MTPAMMLRLITVLALALGASLAAAADDAYPPGSSHQAYAAAWYGDEQEFLRL